MRALRRDNRRNRARSDALAFAENFAPRDAREIFICPNERIKIENPRCGLTRILVMRARGHLILFHVCVRGFLAARRGPVFSSVIRCIFLH